MINSQKKIIFKHGGGELANQLWNYISIYAYGVHSKSQVLNPSFFEYHTWFNLVKNENPIIRFISGLSGKCKGRRNSTSRRMLRGFYFLYSKSIEFIKKNSIISSENRTNSIIYLPPTANLPREFEKEPSLYFKGWLFRNPEGLENYRNELVRIFEPVPSVKKKINEILVPFQNSFKHIIGIHIRQGDYVIFKDGKYLINQKRASEVVHEYLNLYSLKKEEIMFIITSDGEIDHSYFSDLNIYISKENPVTDLFLLSKTEIILGSDSSFGSFAAWYGNIPHIIFKKEPMDWEYYKSNSNGFFKNKYCTMISL